MTTITRYEPMLALSEVLTGWPTFGDWCLQPKVDGWRMLVYITEDGVEFHARSGERYDVPLTYLADSFRSLRPGTVLDGEVYSLDWNHTQSVMSRSIPHVPSDLSPALEYIVFDVLQVNLDGELFPTVNMPLVERLEIVEALHGKAQYLHPCPSVLMHGDGEHADRVHADNLAAGFEGTMVKNLASHYHAGRNRAWRKMKPVLTADGKIVGYTESKAGTGLIGSVIVELESGVTTTASGFKLDQRLAFTQRGDEFLGRMVEIRHNGLWATGSPRHPRWSRFRPDLDS